MLAKGATSDVRLQSAAGSILITDVTAGRDVLLDAPILVQGNHVTVIAQNGKIDINAPVESLAGDVDLTAAGAITTGDITANGGDIDVSGGSVGLHFGDISNHYGASGDVAVDAVDSIAVSGASAGDDVAMRAGGSADVGDLVAGTSGGVEHVGSADALVTSDPMPAFGATGHKYTTLTDGPELDIIAGSDLTVGIFSEALSPDSDIRLQSTGGAIHTGDLDGRPGHRHRRVDLGRSGKRDLQQPDQHDRRHRGLGAHRHDHHRLGDRGRRHHPAFGR